MSTTGCTATGSLSQIDRARFDKIVWADLKYDFLREELASEETFLWIDFERLSFEDKLFLWASCIEMPTRPRRIEARAEYRRRG